MASGAPLRPGGRFGLPPALFQLASPQPSGARTAAIALAVLEHAMGRLLGPAGHLADGQSEQAGHPGGVVVFRFHAARPFLDLDRVARDLDFQELPFGRPPLPRLGPDAERPCLVRQDLAQPLTELGSASTLTTWAGRPFLPVTGATHASRAPAAMRDETVVPRISPVTSSTLASNTTTGCPCPDPRLTVLQDPHYDLNHVRQAVELPSPRPESTGGDLHGRHGAPSRGQSGQSAAPVGVVSSAVMAVP